MLYVVDGKTVGEAICKAGDKTTHDFTQALMKEIFTSLDRVISAPFYLRLEEWHQGAADPEYSITMSSKTGIEEANSMVSKPEEGFQLFETDAVHYYSAFNLKQPGDNYSGHVLVQVIMYGNLAENGNNEAPKFVPHGLADVVLSIALHQYYRKIDQFYPDWRTSYYNGPKVESYPIDNI